MKLRILSDLHLQINREYPLEIANNYDFTLLAGDIGPDYKNNAEWIKRNIHRGAIISGNHDAYTNDNTPIDDVKEFYHKEFPFDSEVTYFDDDVGVISKEIGENILLIADVLYTNFTIPCFPSDHQMSKEQLVEANIRRTMPKMSGSYMNDFWFTTRNGKYEKKYGEKPGSGIFYIHPQNYIDHFNNVIVKITNLIESNPNKDIVLMTHHCMSPKCISPRMDKESLTGAYVTNMESWILKHPNLKLIVSGHVHNEKAFHIGKTLYVMNPLGYCRDNQDILGHRGCGGKWTPDFFVDTDTWKISKTPYENEHWNIQHKKDNDNFLKYMSVFA